LFERSELGRDKKSKFATPKTNLGLGDNMLIMQDIDLTGKRVLIREDLNVPCLNGKILNTARIVAALPTLKLALAAKAKVLVVSHLGRPKAGVATAEFSMRIVADALAKLLPYPVKFVEHWLDGFDAQPGELVVAENVRFLVGETENDPKLAQRMAALCDVFVMDAFGSAHRAHASTVGITKFVTQAVAGPLLMQEIAALDQVFNQPKAPVVALVGGSKVSSKLLVLRELLPKVNSLILGGGIANTFLAAQGYPVGASLYEPKMVVVAQELLATAAKIGCNILLPVDVVVATEIFATAVATQKELAAVAVADKIVDIGSKTIELYTRCLQQAQTILWNGPVGVFEYPQFAEGTRQVALAIAASQAFSVAGGGETLAAIEQLNIQDQLSFVSTGGGAFLEYVKGKTLPAIAALGN